jgi:hypothetical protein
MSNKSIDQTVMDWVLGLPPSERVDQLGLYKSYKRHMTPELARWYVQTNYECQKKVKEDLYKGLP